MQVRMEQPPEQGGEGCTGQWGQRGACQAVPTHARRLRRSWPTWPTSSSSPARRAPATTCCGRRFCSWWISSAAAPSCSPWSGEDPAPGLRLCPVHMGDVRADRTLCLPLVPGPSGISRTRLAQTGRVRPCACGPSAHGPIPPLGPSFCPLDAPPGLSAQPPGLCLPGCPSLASLSPECLYLASLPCWVALPSSLISPFGLSAPPNVPSRLAAPWTLPQMFCLSPLPAPSPLPSLPPSVSPDRPLCAHPQWQ